ncbi:PIN domain-containing protein [Tessaracoccus sp. Z1128]
MSGPVVLLDACTLVPIRLTSCLLSLAEAGLLTPLWSDEILDEVERNLPKLKLMTPDRAKQRVAAMRDAFDEEASVDGYDDLIHRLTCDPKDRHVLAAAIAGGADVLLTFNLKDFPPASAEPHGVSIQHPDRFLSLLLAEHRQEVLDALRLDVARYRQPTMSITQYLAALTATVPTFATLAHDALATEGQDESPVAALIPAAEDEALAALGALGDLTNPAQVAFLWWTALSADAEAVRLLTYDPTVWGDYQRARDLLKGRGLASRVIQLVDAPDRVAVMRFVPEAPTAVQSFASFVTPMVFLTMLRLEDGTWRAWGLGPQILSARDILA